MCGFHLNYRTPDDHYASENAVYHTIGNTVRTYNLHAPIKPELFFLVIA